MANANDFPLLAYLIDMAVLEAWREASEPSDGAAAKVGVSAAASRGATPRQRSDTRWPG